MVPGAVVSKLKGASEILGRAFKMQTLKKSQGFLEVWSRSLYYTESQDWGPVAVLGEVGFV